ncbi:MAG TPA: ABC transporter substrate-binding protein [Candidatus Hydrogenedentes bacterium]|nr:ABC transporter substrate-binding protein [Candidatus Hydrogenedentota bacterium]HOS03550.1 ABC transporter substrate-binding protein [Candidatus Hydrogenedentota bacterium]
MSSLRTLILFVAIGVLLTGLYSLTGAPAPSPPGKQVITLWHPWGGNDGKEFRRLVESFNASQDAIVVRSLFIPNNLSSNQKFFLSVSAGEPPDVVFVDGPQVAEWGARGVLEPLDALMDEFGIRHADFWEPCAKQCQFLGKTYALTYDADPNFAFIWNKPCFADAGLPVDVPPRTIEELDRFSERLTRIDEKGRIRQVGFIPWNVFGMANSIFTWGWAFGGEFYDDAAMRVTCGDDPHILEALVWMKSYADKYGLEAINSFSEGFGDMTDNPFIRGKMAMAAGHVSNVNFFKKYGPNLDYGVAAMPYPSRIGFDNSVWMGGWAIAIPRGSRHPREAFAFMKWMCTSDEAGQSMVVTTGTFPAYKASRGFEHVQGDPKLETFYEILKNTRHQRPVMPAQAFYMGQLERAVSETLYGLKTPKQALDYVQETTQKELDRVMKRARKVQP